MVGIGAPMEERRIAAGIKRWTELPAALPAGAENGGGGES